MKGRKKVSPPLDEDPMKLPWTRDSVVSLKKEDEVQTPSHVFTLTEHEIERKIFQLRYHTCSDAYYRLGSDEAAIEGWERGIYAAVNIERHIDQELAYLTRKTGHREASVSWKVDLRETGLVVDSIQALTLSRTLHGGIITYDIISPDSDQDADQLGYVTNGWQTLYLIAYLSGSSTEGSHDQTQLLYQSSLDNQENFPLDILITLKPLQEILCTCTQDSRQFHQAGTQQVVEVHSPAIEKCTCFFPNETLNTSENSKQYRSPLVNDLTDATQSTESLSIVNKHTISLPGTPVHRRHYGSKASLGSNKGCKLKKKNRVQSLEPTTYDNSGAESPIPMHVLDHVTSPSQSEMSELEVSELERMGNRQGTQTPWNNRAWTDKKTWDNESLVEEDAGSSRHFCKGSLCTIS